MSSIFEKNAYLYAIKANEALNSENKIFNHAKAGLKFKYGDVSVREFNEKYEARGWFGRKVVALPAAIGESATTIYHLVETILSGITPHLGDKKYLKVQFFYIARELQESFGWLVTLFSDKYGQYHIQEGRFQRSCYDCFLIDLEKEFTKIQHSWWGFEAEEKYAQLAEKYLSVGCLYESLQVIAKVHFYRKDTLKGFLEKAAYYINKDNRDKIIKDLKLIFPYGGAAKEIFLEKVAASYYVDGELDKAVETLSKICFFYLDKKEIEELMAKIAEAYVKKGEGDKAIQETRKIFGDNKYKFWIQIARSYFLKNDEAGAIKAIKKIAEELFELNAFNKNKLTSYIEIIIDNSAAAGKFFDSLAKDCFIQAKVHFAANDTQAILQEIRRKSTDDLTLEAFLKLKISRPYTNTKPCTRNNTFSDLNNAQYYSTLGLTPTASKEEVKKAFRALALKYHSDKIKGDANEDKSDLEKRKKLYEEKLKSVIEAYKKITDIE